MSKIKFSEVEIYFVLKSISLRIYECNSLLDDYHCSSGTHAAVNASLKRWISLREKLRFALPKVDLDLPDDEVIYHSEIFDF